MAFANVLSGALWRDIRRAARSLASTPALTALVLVIVALGLGATTAIFSFTDALVLRRLPFPAADRLVALSIVSSANTGSGGRVPFSPPDVVDFRAMQKVFDGLAATAAGGGLLEVDDAQPPEQIVGTRATADLFATLRVAPQLGEVFTAEHEVAGNSAVAVISDRLWRRVFGGDRGAIGRTITLGSVERRIIGVMPPGFEYPVGVANASDIWVPYVVPEEQRTRSGVAARYLQLVGRLKPGVSLEQAQAAMTQVHAVLAEQSPWWFAGQRLSVQPLQEAVVGAETRSQMIFLFGAVSSVLLLVCLNVGNVLLARIVARAGEFHLRAALGAGQWRLVRTALVESLLLVCTGSLLALLVARGIIELLRSALPPNLPMLTSVSLDARVIGVACGATLILGLFIGSVPALALLRMRRATFGSLTEQTVTPTRVAMRLRAGLLVSQISLATVLLVGAALFLASFVRVLRVDLGMDHRNVLMVEVRDRDPLPALLERVRTVPRVEAAAAAVNNLPFLGPGGAKYSVKVPGRELEFWDDDAAWTHTVTPEYREVMRLRLVAGRWLEPEDNASNEPVVVLSEEAARRYLPGRDPVGTVIDISGQVRRVVGVVANVRFAGPETTNVPELYWPNSQERWSTRVQVPITLVIRTLGDPQDVSAAIKSAIWSVSPREPLSDMRSLDEMYRGLVAPRRLNMLLLSIFGGLGLAIASLGIYGMMAFLVTRQTRDIGIRMALGSNRGAIVRGVLQRAAAYIAIGLGCGVLIAWWLSGMVQARLFQVQAADVGIFAIASAVLAAVGLLAALFPALRASRVDPLIALKVV